MTDEDHEEEKCVYEESKDPDYGYFPYRCITHDLVLPMGVIPNDGIKCSDYVTNQGEKK